jgi:hypothetical protein
MTKSEIAALVKALEALRQKEVALYQAAIKAANQ